MKQKIKLFIALNILSLLSTVFIFSPNALAKTHPNGVVTEVSSNPSNVPANTSISLTFTIFQTNELDFCPSGTRLFNNVIWFRNGIVSTDTTAYVKAGSGSTATYTFNSGSNGQKNVYEALFYCAASAVSNPDDLNRQSASWLSANPPTAWATDRFDKVTGSTQAGATNKTYGCKASDGIYACATSPDAASIAACATKAEINSCWCGKTEEQAKTQCGTTSTTPPPSSTLPTDKLINPIPTEGLLDTFLGITKGFLAGLAIWAVIAIIFAGFRMVISAGNEEAITQAKKAITWAILGLVVALLSFSMVAIVQNILNVDTTKFDPGLPAGTYNAPTNKNV